jgi:hypothetical protein
MHVYQKLLSLRSFHSHLHEMDEAILSQARASRCPICGGPLHRSDYDRQARGVAARHRSFYARRFSLCCGNETCRTRLTPFSVRFLGASSIPLP